MTQDEERRAPEGEAGEAPAPAQEAEGKPAPPARETAKEEAEQKPAQDDAAKPAPAAKGVEGDAPERAKPAAGKERPKPAAKAADGEKPKRPARAAKAEGAGGEKPARRVPPKGKAKEEEKPKELSPRHKEFVARLQQAFAGIDFQGRENPDGELAITVPAEKWSDMALHLRDQEGFNYCRSISGVDWKDRLSCVYNLTQVPMPGQGEVAAGDLFRLAVHVDADRDNPVLPSVFDVWPTADYQEREIFDMYGIRFTGHPNLKTLLLPPNWQGGYPLRKDFVDKRPKRQRLVRPR